MIICILSNGHPNATGLLQILSKILMSQNLSVTFIKSIGYLLTAVGYLFANQSASSPQGYGWLVWGEQRQRQHPAMEEEEPAALQPSLRGSQGTGDAGDGAAQPGQPLPGQHWDPSSPLPPTPPPQSPALWHAEGRPAPGAPERDWGRDGKIIHL